MIGAEKQLENETLALATDAKEIVVISAEDNLLANGILKGIMAGKKAIKAYWQEPIENAHKAHRALTAKREEMLKPLVIGEGILKDEIAKYLVKEEAEREAKEREIREEAEKKEKERQAKIAKEEAELREAEGYLSPEEVASEKKKIEAENKKEFVPEVTIEKEAKVPGQITKELWSAEVFDENIIPREYLIVDYKRLNALAVIKKDKFDIPGAKAIKRLSVMTRT